MRQRAYVVGLTVVWTAVIFFSAAYLRFHRITEEGLGEEDSVGYYLVAKKWIEGEKNLWWDGFYRPAVYATNAAALAWIGDTDYSLKVFHGACDLASVALLILVGRRLTGNVLYGLLAAQMYALLPYVVSYSRTAMPHSFSTVLVLAAVAAFCVSASRTPSFPIRLLRDAFAGLLLGIAAHTHAELALLGPGFFAAQCIEEIGGGRGIRRAFVQVLLRGAALTAGFAIPAAAGIAYFGFERVRLVVSNEAGAHAFTPDYIQQTAILRVPYDIFAITSNLLYKNALWMPAFVLVSVTAWSIGLARRRSTVRGSGLTPLALVATYVVLFPFTIGSFDWTYVRVFLPIVPLVFLGFVSGLSVAAGWLPPARRIWVPVSAALFLAVFTPNALFRPNYFASPHFHKSLFRGIYDAVGDRVCAEHQLLIVPSTAYFNHGYSTPFYFGDNAVFLADIQRSAPYTPELLRWIIENRSFSYIYESIKMDPRFQFANSPRTIDEMRWFRGMDMSEFSMEGEKEIIREALNESGAHLLEKTDWGDIYSRRKRPIFPNSGFDDGTLEGWRAGGFALMFAVHSSRKFGPKVVLTEQAVMRDPQKLTRPVVERTHRIDTTAPNRTGKSVASYVGRESLVGELTSPEFTIEEGVIGFRVAGHGDPEGVYVALRVDDVEMRIIPGGDELYPTEWHVLEHVGKRARIIVRDGDPRQNRGIKVAGFYYVL